MTEPRKLNPGSAWAWYGVTLSLAVNLLAAWIIVQVINRPDLPLDAPPSCTAKP